MLSYLIKRLTFDIVIISFSWGGDNLNYKLSNMNLNIKSAQNLSLSKECYKGNKYIQAVSGRPYYAVYQKMKFLLIKYRREGVFDFYKFTNKFNKKNNSKWNAFSHTLIHVNFNELINTIKKKRKTAINITRQLSYIDQLKSIRKRADYESEEIKYEELANFNRLANDFIINVAQL